MRKRRRRRDNGFLPFWRWGSKARPKPRLTRANRKLVFETLEPRILLDADPIPLNGILDLSGEQDDLAITITVTAPGEITVAGSLFSDGTYCGVTSIVGSGGVDQLIGPSANSTWLVTGQNSGQLAFGTSTIDFSGIEDLEGAADTDDA